MPKITIDGNACEFDGKKMILQVALENDIEIPHYCYHPGLSIVANCRICLGEVEAPNPRNDNKLELIPKLVPTCQTPAADGMVVHIRSPKAIANQKAVMEYLLINHPVDCPVCDQAGECYLQDYSYKYGRSESRFMETKAKQPKKDVGPHVLLYSDRCIMCTRCVRFTREVTGTDELAVFGRGYKEQIDVFPGKALDNELSGNVVDICPVGALLDKDFLFAQRVWLLKKARSIDGLTASGDNISVEHNEGKVFRVKPRTNMEVNKWWISDEIRYGWKFVHSEDRLTSPMKKHLGAPEETAWKAAYDEAGQAMKDVAERGGHLAVMVSPMLGCEEAYLLGKLARAIDPQAVLALGPVPRSGEDKTFPGGYTIYAEKCPNSRGVRRVLEMLGGPVLDYADFVQRLGDANAAIGAVILTGNYPSKWTSRELAEAVAGKFSLLIDTLPNDLTDQVDFLLPGATWVEKSGTFENAHHRLQIFQQAIPAIEFVKPEGQIALDLMAAAGVAERGIFDAQAIRREMGEPFLSDIHVPVEVEVEEPDMAYVEL